jgi:hypothetical protein
MRKTGFTPELLERARARQGGRCAICAVVLRPGARQSLHGECKDHDHETGMARGLLCGACNRALGFYEKSQRAAGLVLEPYEKYLSAAETANRLAD